MCTSAPSTSQLISMPGTISSGRRLAASSMASARPSVESWSVMASTRRPRRAASWTSSRGVYVPSEAVVCEWRSTPPAMRLAAVRQRPEVMEHGAYGNTRAALGAQSQVALGEGRARDVEMGPGQAAREVAHEERGDDGAAAALARDIVEVGDIALDALFVFLVQRQPPHPFPRRLGGGQHAARQRFVACEDAGDAEAERHHDRAGERRQVDNLVRLDRLGG